MEIITFTSNEIANPEMNIGELFNQAANANIFEDYKERKTANTKTRHEKELRNFSDFLTNCKYANEGMTTPQEWSGITHGIIEGYQRYMLQQGYSVNSTNQTLYIIKAYAGLAGKAGFIDYVELARIKEVKGYKSGEARNIDKERKAQGADTRISTKKETARSLTESQVYALKRWEKKGNDYSPMELTTLREKRDALIFALFLDMGLRESELMSLTRESFDIESEMLHWYREKTNNRGHETMSKAVRLAAREYFKVYDSVKDEIRSGNAAHNESARNENKKLNAKSDLFAAINQWGQITGGISMRGLQAIVKAAGETIGINNLSPHDLRHSMALRAYLAGVPLKSIQRRLGHSTVKTTERYIDIEALDRYNDFDRDF